MSGCHGRVTDYQSRPVRRCPGRAPQSGRKLPKKGLALELLFEDLVDDARVGAAARKLHHLAHKEADHGFLAAAELLHLLRDRGSMSPAEIWDALGVSRQGAMDLLRPLLDAGLVEKSGSKKTGRYLLRGNKGTDS